MRVFADLPAQLRAPPVGFYHTQGRRKNKNKKQIVPPEASLRLSGTVATFASALGSSASSTPELLKRIDAAAQEGLKTEKVSEMAELVESGAKIIQSKPSNSHPNQIIFVQTPSWHELTKQPLAQRYEI